MTRPDLSERNQAIVAMRLQGATNDAIADLFHITPQRVWQIARDAGVAPRRKDRRRVKETIRAA